MKIAPRNVDGLLNKPPDNLRAVLLYGPDIGLVRERALILAKTVADDPGDPFRVAEITPPQLKDEPGLLRDEMAALALTGGRRLVRLRSAGNAEAGAVQAVLDASDGGDSVLLVEAGELGPRDAMRKIFEAHEAAAAVACYADEGQTLDALVRGILGGHGLDAEADAVALLVGILGADRALSRQELEKLALYKGKGAGPVTVADVRACVGDDAPLARDDVALAVGSGDQPGLDRALARCFASGDSPVSVLRAVTRHFDRLHRLSERVRAGASVDQAVRSARPPIFFKHQATIRGQLQQWRPGGIAAALGLLMDAETACKTTGNPDLAICSRALLRIANAARRERRSS